MPFWFKLNSSSREKLQKIVAFTNANFGRGSRTFSLAAAKLKDIMAVGQKEEAKTLVKAVKLYLGKRLDVHWGVGREV